MSRRSIICDLQEAGLPFDVAYTSVNKQGTFAVPKVETVVLAHVEVVHVPEIVVAISTATEHQPEKVEPVVVEESKVETLEIPAVSKVSTPISTSIKKKKP
jgi:hypothetical protein